MMRITSFAARNYRSLFDVHMEKIPSLVLLYGDNDAGKSNLIEAIGSWIWALQELCAAAPGHRGNERLYQGHEDFWSEGTAKRLLGERYLELFTHEKSQLELEGTLRIHEGSRPSEKQEYSFGLRLSREAEAAIKCTVLCAIWPGGRRVEKRSEMPQEHLDMLRRALRHPWQRVAASRELNRDEMLPVRTAADQDTRLDPTGSNLKLRLFLAANAIDPELRRVYRDGFLPLVQNGPFRLPEASSAMDYGGRIELLLGDHAADQHGSGPQQWLLIAGLLAMSHAPVAAIEEPEAHMSWEAQGKLARTLKELIEIAGRSPNQLFLSTHSVRMVTGIGDPIWYSVTGRNAGTEVRRVTGLQELLAKFWKPDTPIPDSSMRVFAGGILRLPDEIMQHLDAEPGSLVFKKLEADGSVRLMGESWMGGYLDGTLPHAGKEESK